MCVCACKHEDIFLHSQSLPVTSGLQHYLSNTHWNINRAPGDTYDLCADGEGLKLERICDQENEGLRLSEDFFLFFGG